MRIDGKQIEGPNTETIVIPRGEKPPIVFIAKAVLDWEDFDRLCPTPKAPIIMRRGGEKIANVDDPKFLERQAEYGVKRMAWLIVKSLEATPNLEWEHVDLGNPNTWLKLDDELKQAGFSSIEVGRIRQGVFIANCLDEEKVEEARRSFLASALVVPAELSFQKDEHNGTASSEPVSDLEFSRQE